nr:hypothetical protein [Methylosinus sporium]
MFDPLTPALSICPATPRADEADIPARSAADCESDMTPLTVCPLARPSPLSAIVVAAISSRQRMNE